jgi:type VI secretion system protein ImpC
MSDNPNLASTKFSSGSATVGQARRVPFRIVVIGDFGLPSGRLHGFEDQDLEEELGRVRPRLDLTVPNHLGVSDRPLTISLEIGALRDFSPIRLLETVPVLAEALAARERLRTGADPAAVAAILPGLSPDPHADPAPTTPSPPPSATPPERPSDSDDPLDRLFDLVDPVVNEAPPQARPSAADDPAKRAVSAFICSMSGRRPAAAAANGKGGAVTEAERRIAGQIAAIVDDLDLRALETAWRGLRFLLRHSDRHAQCFVHVISTSKEDAAEATRAILVDAADQQPAGLGLVVAAYDYGAGPAEMARLQALAELGAEIQVPVVTSAGPDFVHGGTKLARNRDPETVFQDAAYAPWTSLRTKPAARWLGVTINRFMLRPAQDLVGDRQVAFSERSGASQVGAPLEAGGAWLVAALATRSAADNGWPSELTGPDRVIDALPLYGDTEAANVFAVAMPLRPDAAASLANAGLIALLGHANRDIARLVRVPSVHTARADPSGGLPRGGTFDYQLLVSRLIRQIEGNADLIFAAGPAAAVRDAMQRFLAGLLGAGAEVRVTLETDDEAGQALAIRITTGRDILGGVTVELDLAV